MIEASELEEEFLWKTPEKAQAYLTTEKGRNAVRNEIGDVLIYALLFCERVGIDPLVAIWTKVQQNAEKYPVDEVQGQPALEE